MDRGHQPGPRRALAQLGALVVLVNLVWTALGSAATADPARPVRIVALGDSLTAGYMLQPGEAFPTRLAAALEAKGHAVEVINAGVSGDTTSAGLERLDWAIPEGTDAVILELGANDALRGIDPAIVRAKLERIIVALKAKGIPVLLAGMKAPRNWGEGYTAKFDAIYPELAEKHGLLLYPFFLDGVAMDAALNLGDGLHPNPRGVDKIVAGILPHVQELIARVKERRLTAGKG
jgi:acyl-CoA thioesterase-1